MAKTEGRASAGKHNNYDFCVFEDQLNSKFENNLKILLKKGYISGYVISPLHDKDHYNFMDEVEDKKRNKGFTTKKAGEHKPNHYHIAVSFTNPKTAEEVFDWSMVLYNKQAWEVQKTHTWDLPYELSMKKGGVRGRLDYYLHWKHPEKFLYNKKDLKIVGTIIEDNNEPCIVNGEIVKPFNKDEIGNMFSMVCPKDPRTLFDKLSGFTALGEMSDLFNFQVFVEPTEIGEPTEIIVYSYIPTTLSRVERAFNFYREKKDWVWCTDKYTGVEQKEFKQVGEYKLGLNDFVRGKVEKIEGNRDFSSYVEVNSENAIQLGRDFVNRPDYTLECCYF